MVGEIDVDRVANCMPAGLMDWWLAYGILNDWFPRVDENRRLSPDEALRKLQNG